MTTNALVLTVVWLGLALHLLAGILTVRHTTAAPLMPTLNLLVAVLIIAFWAQRWYGYLFRDIRWYATDQLVPAYAVVVCIIAGMALWGRHPNAALNTAVFILHTVVLLCACLLFAFLRFDRMM